jgi:hypothetical protein
VPCLLEDEADVVEVLHEVVLGLVQYTELDRRQEVHVAV